jgi:hypothetical protein
MAYGLRIRDANGTVRLDTSGRITRQHAVYTKTSSFYYEEYAGDGYYILVYRTIFSVPGFTNDGTWFFGGIKVTGRTEIIGTTAWASGESIYVDCAMWDDTGDSAPVVSLTVMRG